MTRRDRWFGAAMAVWLAFVIYNAADIGEHEHESWEKTRDAQHCQPIRHDDPAAGISTIPGQTTWLCDGGKTITRNDD